MARRAAQCVASHGVGLPRCLATVSSLRGSAAEAEGLRVAYGRPDRDRGPGVLAAYRARSSRQRWHEELPPGSDPQLLLIRCRPGTARGQAVLGGTPRTVQASAEEGDVLLGVR